MAVPKQVALSENPLALRLDKEEAKKTGRFLALFVLIYLVLSVVVPFIIPELLVKQAIAQITAAFFNGVVGAAENPLVEFASGSTIEISFLCTGLTELFIIVAVILASIGISVRKRIIGAVVAAVAVFALNIFRIFATVGIILGSGSLELIELTHNIFFRAFLFVSIAAIYIAWFYWAVRLSKQNV